MRYALAPVALAALAAATPVPQGVTESIAPKAATPSGCQTSYNGEFNIQIVNVTDSSSKRSIQKVRFRKPLRCFERPKTTTDDNDQNSANPTSSL